MMMMMMMILSLVSHWSSRVGNVQRTEQCSSDTGSSQRSVCHRTPQSVFSIHIFTRGAGNSGAARSSRVRHLEYKLGLGLCPHFTILCVCGDCCQQIYSEQISGIIPGPSRQQQLLETSYSLCVHQAPRHAAMVTTFSRWWSYQLLCCIMWAALFTGNRKIYSKNLDGTLFKLRSLATQKYSLTMDRNNSQNI